MGDRPRVIETDRQTDRQTERERDAETDRPRVRERERESLCKVFDGCVDLHAVLDRSH